MANTPTKPVIDLIPWTTGETLFNSANMTAGVNTNISNIKTAVDGVIDCIDDMQKELAPAYDATSTYEVGDLCTYQGGLYACSTAIPVAEAWDPSHWTATDVAEQFGNISASPMVETTWAELKALRDAGQLVPGMQYRITDYQCTTITANTSSGNHPFDIIVTADSENTLNEAARAALHAGDTYFASCKLSAWRLWYSLDNDWSRFKWADTDKIVSNNTTFTRYPADDKLSATHKYAWYYSNPAVAGYTVRYTDTAKPAIGDLSYNGSSSTATSAEITSITEEGGKGVIYRMIDEWNNDIPYDFKNIRFTKSGNKGYTNAYTFSITPYTYAAPSDGSILNKGYYLDNVIKVYKSDAGCELNFTVFYSQTSTVFIRNNTFGGNCYNNTFRGYQVQGNVFGYQFHDNYASSHIFDRNHFECYCYNNTFAGDINENIVGNYFYNNTTEGIFERNTLGNGCYGNTFKGNNRYNWLGNQVIYTTLGNSANNNVIGNYAYGLTIGAQVEKCTFGNYMRSVTIGSSVSSDSYIRYCQVDDGVSNIKLTSEDSASSSNWLQNVHIHSGVHSDSGTMTINVARNLPYSTDVYASGSVRMEI